MPAIVGEANRNVNADVSRYVGSPDPRCLELWHSPSMSGGSGLGTIVRALRKERGLTQADLAAAIGIARSTIAGIERGHYMPGRESLIALADFFRVPVEELGHGVARPRPPRDSEVVDDPNELAWLRFWRALTLDQRSALFSRIDIPKRNDTAA